MKQNSLIWEFSPPYSQKRSYLLGTMHVRADEAFSDESLILALIDSVHGYIGEMDLNDPDLKKLENVFFNNGVKLDEILGQKKYNKYRRSILKSFGIDINHYIHLKPIILSNAIAESTLSKDYDLFLDGHLWNYAMDRNKVMSGLESVYDQANILACIPMDYQVNSIAEIAKNPARFKSKIKTIAKAYSEKRLNDLYKISKKSMGGLRKLMLYDRNKRMADTLMEYNKAEYMTVFVSVGAAHLAGNKGILAQLKKNGYKVKAIS